MTTAEMKRPRSVLEHRRGLVPNHQGRNRIVSQPTGPVTLIGNPDDDGQIINALEAEFTLQRRAGCPVWCTGHRPNDAESTFCAHGFYDWVEAGKDTVVVTAAQYAGEQARVCLWPGDSDERGGRYPADKARKIAALLLKGADLIDPPKAA